MPEIIPNLHPLLVHFPIVLISLSALFHLAALATRGKTCTTHCAVLAHATLWLGTLAVLAVLAGWDVWRSKVDTIPTWWFAATVIGAWGLVIVTAWHGSELVYRHGLGVILLPSAETGHAHGHDHSTMPDAGEHNHADAMPKDITHEHSHDEHTHKPRLSIREI